MMHSIPEVSDVVEMATGLGLHLSADEAAVYHAHVVSQLRAFDQFVQSPLDESPPPVTFAGREPGRRPTDDEDPLHAWLWRCEIRGAESGLLAGKTVGFKDHIAVASMPLTFGSFAMDGNVADFDATIVARALGEGATVVGKHTMNGLSGGFGFGGEIGDYGRPRNPHDPAHLAGGSSSGSAVAVACGECDISFGGDQGGSVRVPAAWCGIVGHKPTFGLVSHFGVGFGAEMSVDYVGPLARTVEDAAAALQAVAGYDGLDPRQGRDIPESVDVLGGLADGVRGLRVGVLEEGFVDAEPVVRDCVTEAVDVLAGAGAQITPVSIPRHFEATTVASALMAEGARAIANVGYFGAFAKTYYPRALTAAINRLWAFEPDALAPRTKLNYLVAEFSRREFHGQVYAKAHNVRPGFVRLYDDAFASVDALLMPTTLMRAPRFEPPESHLADIEQHLSLARDGIHRNARNMMPFNYTGHPAIAVPCGNVDGLPVSMQLVGRFFEDALLLRIAHAYEHSVDWDSFISVPPSEA
jgi:amidase